jgi:hypothetical protein
VPDVPVEALVVATVMPVVTVGINAKVVGTGEAPPGVPVVLTDPT